MAKFNDFTDPGAVASADDYVAGYAAGGGAGSDRRWKMSAIRTFVAGALGVAAATSLAIGGATIGTNALAMTGTSALAGDVTVSGTNNSLILPSGAVAASGGSGLWLAGSSKQTGISLGNSESSIGFAVSTSAFGWALIGGATSGFRSTSAKYIGWVSGSDASSNGTLDLALWRDAANTLAQRNGTAAQFTNIYRSWTDASNNYGIQVRTGDTTQSLNTFNAGTGPTTNLGLGTGGTIQWFINASGHFLAISDNAYDIGASGATRPRNVYIAGTLNVGNAINVTNNVNLGSEGQIYAPSAGVIRLTNVGGTDFARLQFGGTTSSFPALKRSTTILQARLADDSAYSPVETSTIRTVCVAIASLPAAGSAGRRTCVTDQITACPVPGTALTAGGALVCPVFDNGAAWVGG